MRLILFTAFQCAKTFNLFLHRPAPVLVLLTRHTAYAVRRYFEVQLPETTRAILLGFAVLLPAVWVPVLAGAVWGPAAAGHRERVFALSSPNGEPSFERDGAYDTVDATELRAVAVGMFFFLSVPLGFFLPLFVEHFVSMAGQTL